MIGLQYYHVGNDARFHLLSSQLNLTLILLSI
jgi:hypothetical protein